MKMSRGMIHPELRFGSHLLDFIIGSDEKGFRRTNRIFRLLKGSKLKGFVCREEYISSRSTERKIRLRIFRPGNAGNDIPGILYIHGGGYAMGLPESDLGTIGKLLKSRDCMVVAPDYTVSLNEPYPAALDDCYDTLLWMYANSKVLGFDNKRIFTIGSSAGGGLAIAVNLRTRDSGGPPIAYSMPLYPMLDDRMQTGSMNRNNAPVWDEKRTREAWRLYLKGINQDDITYYAAPGRCTDFTGHPPVCTLIGTLDPFFDETNEFVKKLKDKGIKVDFRIFEGAYHAFEIACPHAEISKAAVGFYIHAFENAVDSHLSS